MEPQKATDPAALDAKERYDPDRATPQELAEMADLHINTVKKVIAGHYVHRNSVTKFLRALERLDAQQPDQVVNLHGGSNGTRPTPETENFNVAFEQLTTRLFEFTIANSGDHAAFNKVNTDSLRTNLDVMSGLIASIEAAKKSR